jgi:hypothetical protein
LSLRVPAVTARALAWAVRTIGPSIRSMARSSAATSSCNERNGSGAADTCRPSAASGLMIIDQLDPSAQAPWTSTTLTSLEDIFSS